LGNFRKIFQIQNPAKQIGIQIKIQISKTGKIERKSKTEKIEKRAYQTEAHQRSPSASPPGARERTVLLSHR
jgi:hypothetical protein